ncbi:hypothetical protein FA95DRAFT_442218 [Auriscalpium vulgare]|uniref:Uncharacterized protein n=1 Tax=Auriscalpium vulgare TaxID=40419 RepID=A0ACB8RGS4_9AGAM|nr:hypothetical protein FA95DRAFT_442218 [Auriscalpium vulgare]
MVLFSKTRRSIGSIAFRFRTCGASRDSSLDLDTTDFPRLDPYPFHAGTGRPVPGDEVFFTQTYNAYASMPHSGPYSPELTPRYHPAEPFNRHAYPTGYFDDQPPYQEQQRQEQHEQSIYDPPACTSQSPLGSSQALPGTAFQPTVPSIVVTPPTASSSSNCSTDGHDATHAEMISRKPHTIRRRLGDRDLDKPKEEKNPLRIFNPDQVPDQQSSRGGFDNEKPLPPPTPRSSTGSLRMLQSKSAHPTNALQLSQSPSGHPDSDDLIAADEVENWWMYNDVYRSPSKRQTEVSGEEERAKPDVFQVAPVALDPPPIASSSTLPPRAAAHQTVAQQADSSRKESGEAQPSNTPLTPLVRLAEETRSTDDLLSGTVSGTWRVRRHTNRPPSVRLDIAMDGADAADYPDLRSASVSVRAPPEALAHASPRIPQRQREASRPRPLARAGSSSSRAQPSPRTPASPSALSLFSPSSAKTITETGVTDTSLLERELAMSEVPSVSSRIVSEYASEVDEPSAIVAIREQFSECLAALDSMLERLSVRDPRRLRDPQDYEALVRAVLAIGNSTKRRLRILLPVVAIACEPHILRTGSTTERRWLEKLDHYLKSVERSVHGLELTATYATARSDLDRLFDKLQRFDLKLNDLIQRLVLTSQILREQQSLAAIMNANAEIRTRRKGKRTMERAKDVQTKQMRTLMQENRRHRAGIDETLRALRGE